MKHVILSVMVILLAFNLTPIAAQQGKTYYVEVRVANVWGPTLQLTQPISALQERLNSVQSELVTQTEAITPEITNLMARLTQLIARATDSAES